MINQGFYKCSRSLALGVLHDVSISSRIRGNCFLIYQYITLSANWEQKRWKDLYIEPGELVCSYGSIAKEVGLTISQVRSSIGALINAHYITQTTHERYQVIRVVNYQVERTSVKSKSHEPQHESQHESHTNNAQNIATTKEDKNIRNNRPADFVSIYSVLTESQIKAIQKKCKSPLTASAFIGQLLSLDSKGIDDCYAYAISVGKKQELFKKGE